ncbi:hypothetical protein [Rhizobacter sp. Root1221]|uniref:hypothetical protein n=1 Tax=Rhizobacter sp. Root1221 TaxID=1736433 RepID=UPI0006F51BD5|nr:hypothetical protein [Rhizobacter sp. Root1221]KQV99314.1 hypothetical protein ASC87_21245 [Rhizobacter sp. Root1221]
MSVIKGLRTLVRLKARRVEQYEEALRESKLSLQQAREALEEVRAQETAQRDAEHGVRDNLAFTTAQSHGFHGSDVVTLQLLLAEAAQRTTEAVKETQRAEGRVEAAQQHVAECDSALKRGKEQLERTEQRLQDAIADRERAQEDSQDEEAEETAVARMLARSRATAAARCAEAGA